MGVARRASLSYGGQICSTLCAMKYSPFLTFESSAFTERAHATEKATKESHRKALAVWLGEQLRAQGLPAGDVVVEEFGWCVIPLETKPCRHFVVCTDTGDKEDSWQVFAFVKEKCMNQFLCKDKHSESLDSLFAVVKKILQTTPTVNDLRQEDS